MLISKLKWVKGGSGCDTNVINNGFRLCWTAAAEGAAPPCSNESQCDGRHRDVTIHVPMQIASAPAAQATQAPAVLEQPGPTTGASTGRTRVCKSADRWLHWDTDLEARSKSGGSAERAVSLTPA